MNARSTEFTLKAEKDTWTGKIRESALEALPPDRLLPDRQPAYVASWAYIFGALTLGAFAVVLLSGAVLAVEGPAWWHKSNVGLFVNSTHLWSTELFFMFMVVHLWVKFLMAAWRGKRKATWITGVLTFVISIATAFTGYLSQQNFDSEWIGTQAKDGINATGAGAFWDVLNFGQMLMWHIVLLPLVVAVLTGVHVLLVRRRGVVPPFAPTEAQLAKAGLSGTSPLATATLGLADTELAEPAPQIETVPSELSAPPPVAQSPPAAPLSQAPVPQLPDPTPPTQASAVPTPPAEETAAEQPPQESLWQLPEDQS